MTGQGSGPGAERRRLEQIISGMTDGVILADPDGAITWANGAALSMHGIGRVVELGRTIEAYRSRFKLRTCGGVEPGLDATERDVLVEVTPLRRRRPVWVHQVRTLVLTDEAGETDCRALILRDVTERVEAERRFEASFDVNPAPAVICRLHDRTVVKVNTGFLQLTGYAARQIVGRRFTEIDVLDGVGDADSVQARLLGGEPLGQTEARLRTAEGREKPVIIAGQPIELGEEKCTMFTFVDLQPRRAAEEALRESEARAKAYFEALYAQAPVALHSLDRDRRIVSVSDRWLELLGYTREEVVGRPIADFLPDREAGRAFARHWDTLLAEGVVHDLRHRFVKRSGAIVDVLVSARAEQAKSDEAPRTVAALFDISERRRLEERFAKLFELAPVPMAVIERATGRMLSVNQALLSCLGRSADEAQTLHLWEIVEDGGRIEAMLARGEAVRNLETRLSCGAESVLDCLVSADTVHVGGETQGLVVLQDITDRRRSEAQLFEAIETVMRDTSWFTRSVIERLNQLRQPAGDTVAPVEALTARETEILALVSSGLGNGEVAERLGLSRSTVRNHLGAIYGKLDVHSRSAAIIWARERGILASGGGGRRKARGVVRGTRSRDAPGPR